MKVGDSSGSGRLSEFTSKISEGQTDSTSVKLGEKSLAEVAERLGVSEEKLLAANPKLTRAGELKAGQELKLPQATKEAVGTEKAVLPEEPPMRSEAQEQRLTSRLFKGRLFGKLFRSKAERGGKELEMSATHPASTTGGGDVLSAPHPAKTPDVGLPPAPEPFPNKAEIGKEDILRDKVLFKGKDGVDAGHGKIGLTAGDEAGILKRGLADTGSAPGSTIGAKVAQEKVLIDPSEIRSKPPITRDGFEDPLTAKPRVDKGFEDPLTARPGIRDGFEDPLTAKPRADKGFEDPLTARPEIRDGFEDPLTAKPRADKGFEDPLTARPGIRDGFEDPLTAKPRADKGFEDPLTARPGIRDGFEDPLTPRPGVRREMGGVFPASSKGGGDVTGGPDVTAKTRPGPGSVEPQPRPNVGYPPGGPVIEERIPGKINPAPGEAPGGPRDVSPRVTGLGEGIGPAPRIMVKIQDEVVVATPGRKLTAGESGPGLRQEMQRILDGGERKILLDMSGVESMDSSGLGELTWLKDAADAVEAKIALLNLDGKLQALLDESGLSRLMEVFENEADAIKYLGR